MNTNGSRMIDEIITLLKKKIMVIVTISFDGIDNIHDYVRWPIKWEKFTKTVEKYKKLQSTVYKNYDTSSLVKSFID